MAKKGPVSTKFAASKFVSPIVSVSVWLRGLLHFSVSNLCSESFVHKVSRKIAAAKNGQVSRKFAAAKNGQVSRKFDAVKIGQVSRKFAAAKMFVANSFRFSPVVRTIENDVDYVKENLSIPPMPRVMDPNSLPAEKCVDDFFRFNLAM